MRLRKRIFAGVLLCFVFVLVLFIRTAKSNARLKHYTAVADPIMINGREYHGRAPLLSDQDVLYFPIQDLGKAFGKDEDEAKIKRKKLVWGEKEYSLDEKDVLRKMKVGGAAVDFISTDAMETVLKVAVERTKDGACYMDTFPRAEDAWIKQGGQLIANSMGMIDDHVGTNSKEAFIENYKSGFRVFAADISLTSDDVPVAVKDWREFRDMAGLEDSKQALAEETFRSVKLYEKYTPLGFADICKLMVAYPDMYLVISTEASDVAAVKELYLSLLDVASRFDSKILDRMVPQIYTTEMGDGILGQRSWKSAIYNFSRTDETVSEKSVLKYALDKGISCFAFDKTYSDDYMIEAIHRFGGKVFLQCYDDANSVKLLQDVKQVDGFFTNALAPKQITP